MGESSNVMSNDARIQLVKSKHRKIKFRDTMLSVSGIALFFLIWELLVVTGTVDSKKLCDVLEIFKLFIVKLTDPNPDGAVLIEHLVQPADCAVRLRSRADHRHSLGLVHGLVQRL